MSKHGAVSFAAGWSSGLCAVDEAASVSSGGQFTNFLSLATFRSDLSGTLPSTNSPPLVTRPLMRLTRPAVQAATAAMRCDASMASEQPI
jgi:hypothetical protein